MAEPTVAAGAAGDGQHNRRSRHLDLVDVLTGDHLVVDDLFVQFQRVGRQRSRIRDLVDVTVAELMRHDVAEEQYLYPLVRRCLDDGEELAAAALAAHHDIERLMSDLMGTDAEHPVFASLVGRLIRAVRTHFRHEETAVFPRLRATCEPDDLVNLGTEVLSAKMLAPTRPHPSAPRGRITGPLIGLLDQAVDALTDRPTSVDEL
jgi:hemerythrin superfamily protein